MRATEHLRGLLAKALSELSLPWPEKTTIEPPRDKNFGDLATNVALVAAKPAKTPPRELAERLRQALLASGTDLAEVTVAGPGFLNVTFAPAFWQQTVLDVLAAGPNYGQGTIGAGTKVQVEFVSANPTGPLHIGHDHPNTPYRLQAGGRVMDTAERAQAILDRLRGVFPQAAPALAFTSAYELLVATVLAAQCTDARVNLVTPEFFRRWPDPAALSRAPVAEVETVIHSTGFFRQKAKNLVAAAAMLTEHHGGQLPASMLDGKALTDYLGEAKPLTDNHPKRLVGYPASPAMQQRFVTDHNRLMDAMASRDRFVQSTEAALLLPEAIRRQSLDWFAAQQIENTYLNSMITAPSPLPAVNYVLTGTDLQVLPLWLMERARAAIAERRFAAFRAELEAIYPETEVEEVDNRQGA